MTSIDAKVPIDRYDWPRRKPLAQADEAEIGKVGLSIGVPLRERPDPPTARIEVEIDLDKPGIDQRQHVRHRIQMKGGLG